MPLIKPIEMNAPRQAASAFLSSERAGVGLTMGCRINLILRDDGAPMGSRSHRADLTSSCNLD